MKTTTT